MKINLEQLKHALSAQTFKTDLVANNMANINTSGYKRDIMFMDLLDKFDTNYDNKGIQKELKTIFKERMDYEVKLRNMDILKEMKDGEVGKKDGDDEND